MFAALREFSDHDTERWSSREILGDSKSWDGAESPDIKASRVQRTENQRGEGWTEREPRDVQRIFLKYSAEYWMLVRDIPNFKEGIRSNSAQHAHRVRTSACSHQADLETLQFTTHWVLRTDLSQLWGIINYRLNMNPPQKL